MRQASRNSGFVLVIVLLVIVIATTALAATVRHSCEQALGAADRLRKLQLRWGAMSCKAVCLPRAELMLQDRPETDQGPRARVRSSVKLGDITFHLIIGDEQAKANANLLATRRGKSGLIEAIRMLQIDQRHILRTSLRPTGVKTDPASATYGSFGQLLSVGHPSDLVTTEQSDKAASDRITCWSDGRVNFKRTDRRVLRQVFDGVLDETHIDTLIQIREDVPDCTLIEALKQLELKKSIQKIAQTMLTDTSRCHSLWIVAEGSSRRWYQLHISGATHGNEEWNFIW